MIRWGTNSFAFAASAAIVTSAASAEELVDPFALTPEQLFSAEVISASRSAESVWESPAAVFVITASDIERAGVTSIAEALRLAPGVQVGRINTSGWAVSVRGFNSALANKLLVLVDGRETYDPLFSGVYWDVQDMALEDIDRIEIIRGPGASLWGANAVNGVINIITKRAEHTQGALVSVAAGDVERASTTLRYGGAWGAGVHWRTYLRAFDRDAQERLAGGDDNSDWQAGRAGFRVDAALNGDDALSVQGDIYRSETGQLRAMASFSPPFSTLAREDVNAEGGNVLARWTRELQGDARLIAQAYVDFTRRAQATLEDRRRTFDFDIQYEFPTLGAHDVIAGLRYRNTRDDVTNTEMIRSVQDSHQNELVSAFFQDQIALSPAWRLTVGSKFDENDYTGFEIQPSVRLQWMGEGQMVWGAVSRAVRTPSELDREFNILFAAVAPAPGGSLPFTLELFPSPAFESEEALAYELGYRREFTPSVGVDVAVFHTEYDGLSTLTPLAPQLGLDPPRIILVPLIMSNSTAGQVEGAEVALNWLASESFNLSFTYSFLDIELDGPATAFDAEAGEGQSPRNQASVRAHWAASDRLSFDATLYYADELPAYQIDSYVRADLRVAYQLTDALQAEIVGQGLLGDAHREFGAPGDANAAEIGRSVFGRLTWRP